MRIKEKDMPTFEQGPLWRVPVFDAGAGEPNRFSDAGFPVGHSDEFIHLVKSEIDEHTFAVRVHGDSMLPTLKEGDRVVVVPSRQLENGCICFATWSDDEFGERLVKRYRIQGSTIILESDNRKHDPIILTKENGNGVKIFRVTQIVKIV